MTDLGKVYVQIMPSAKGISGSISKILKPEAESAGKSAGQNIAQNLSKSLRSMGKQLTKSITLPVMGAATAASGFLLKGGWDRIVGLDAARAQLEGLGYDFEAVERISNLVNESIQGTTMTMADGVSVAAGALAAGVKEGAELERFIGLVGDAAVGSGREVNEMGMIFNRVQGMGKLMTQELNMIEDGMPGFSQAMAKHFGVGQAEFREMVTAGEVSSQDFLDVMDDFAGGMSDAYSKSWAGIFSRVKSNLAILGEYMLEGMFPDAKEALSEFLETIREDDIRNWARGIGDTIGETFRGLIETIKDVTNWWKNLSDGGKQAVKTMAVIALTMGPILTIASKLALAISAIVGVVTAVTGALASGATAFAAFKAGALAIMGPVGWITAGIAALIAAGIALYMNWDTISAKAKNIWTSIQDSIINSVLSSEESLNSFTDSAMSSVGDLWTSIYNIWESSLSSIFSTNNKYLNDILMSFDKVMMEAWMIVEAVWTYIGQSISNAVGIIIALVSGDFAVVKDLLEQQMIATQEMFSGIWQSIEGIFSGSLDFIKNFTLGIFEEIATGSSGIWSTIASGMLGALDSLGAAFDNLRNRASALWESFTNLEIIAVVSDSFRNFRDRVSELLAVFSSFSIVDQIQEAFSNLRDTVEELWARFENTAVFGLISGAIENVIGRVVGFKDAILALVHDFDLQPMLEQVIQFIPKLIGIFISKKAGMILGGANIIQAIAEGMGMTAPELIQMVTDTIVSTIEQFSAALPGYVEQGTDMIIAFIDGLVAQIPMLTDTAINIIMTLVEGLLGSIMTIVEAGITLITALMEGIILALPQIIEIVMQLVTVLIGAIVIMLPVIIQTGIQLLMSLIEGIISALPMIIETVILLFTTLLEAIVSMLPVIIEAGIQLLMSLIEGIILMLPMIIETVIQLVTAFMDSIILMLPLIIDAGIQLLTSLIEGIILMLPTIIDTGMTLVMSLFDSLIAMLPIIIEAGMTLLMSLIEGIIGMLPALINAGIQLIISLADAFISMLPTIISAGISLLTALISGIVQVLPALISAGIQLIVALGGAILQMIPTIISAGIQILGALVQGILSVIGQLLSAGGQLMSSLLSEILSFLGQMLSAGGDLITSLINGVKGVIGDVVSAVGSGINDAWQEVTSFGDKFKEAGSNIIGNIASGISGAIGKVTGAVGNVLSAARNLLPFSPPKDKTSPLVDIHKNGIGEQIAKGILSGRSEVQSAMHDLLSIPSDYAVLGGLDSNLNLSRANGQVQYEVNSHNGQLEQLLTKLANQEQIIVLDSGELVGATYPKYDRAGGNQTQEKVRWSR